MLLAGTVRGGSLLYRNVLITTAGGEGDPRSPTEFRLLRAFPNPFNSSTMFAFRTVAQGVVSLRVVDLLGRKIIALLASSVEPGEHRVRCDASGCASGASVGILNASGGQTTRTVLLLR